VTAPTLMAKNLFR